MRGKPIYTQNLVEFCRGFPGQSSNLQPPLATATSNPRTPPPTMSNHACLWELLHAGHSFPTPAAYQSVLGWPHPDVQPASLQHLVLLL